MIGAEADRPESGNRNQRHGAKDDCDGKNVEPGKVGGNKILHRVESGRHGVRKDARESDSQKNRNNGRPENGSADDKAAFRSAAGEKRLIAGDGDIFIRQNVLLSSGCSSKNSKPFLWGNQVLRREPNRKTARSKGLTELV